MKRLILIAALLAWAGIACANLSTEPNDNPTDQQPGISGRVTCEGAPVSGAVISDGIDVTTTDAQGNYTLSSGGFSGYVFISAPAGYKVPNDGISPKHYVNIRKKEALGVDFELLRMADSYTLFVMADVHLTGSTADKDLKQFRGKFLPDITAEIEQTEGEVVSLSLGDMTTDTRWYSNDFYFPQYLREFKTYPSPLYHIMGNHDNDPQATGDGEALAQNAKSPYRKYMGPTYYSLNIGQVHYVMLDNILTGGRYIYRYLIDPVQLEWLKKDLSLVDKSTPLIVSMHVPAYQYSGIKDGIPQIKKRTTESQDVSTLINVLKPFREVHILSGHDHQTRNIRITNNIMEHSLVSVSAISWKINDVNGLIISHDGTPSGYLIFRVNQDRIDWQFKAVGQTREESQFRMYDLNIVPSTYGGNPGMNEILLNVFNWDPEWEVSISVNGHDLVVEQVYAKDPLYMINRDKTKVFPTRPNDWRGATAVHLFRAKASSATSQVEVKVTDRFGNTFSQIVSRPKTFNENSIN